MSAALPSSGSPSAQRAPKQAGRRPRVVLTAALPYANGSAHMGHLVEYLMADMFVRARRQLGTDVLFVCASDAHGTPIELNAAKRNMAPADMVAQVREEQQKDFRLFGIEFDIFGNTHADSNKKLVTDAYQLLKQRGLIEERELLGTYCAHDKRFLPDRFVKGGCPRCQAADQYGDVCERCGATYGPEDLLAPACALCGRPPERKPSRHAFFLLSKPEQTDFLRTWIDSGTLQTDVANYVRSWLDQGLKDWCISRDKPYFGFPIPDMEDKFFYVWLDAPFGYVAATQDWAAQNGVSLDSLWRAPDVQVEHIIGKDIMYFHTLFWPAVLRATDYTLPSKVHVHGMLTVDGEKMSKSRGTFINARVFAEHVEPEILRYYFATKYTPESRDIALSFADMVARINGELINKYVNLFSRLGRFVHSRLDGQLGALPFDRAELHADVAESPPPAHRDDFAQQALLLARQTLQHAREIEAAYAARDIARVTRHLSAMADLGNEMMQVQTPWALVDTDKEAARRVCTVVANVCDALITYLAPIVPALCQRAAATFHSQLARMDTALLFGLQNTRLGPFERLLERLDPKALERVVAASKQPEAAPTPAAAAATTARPAQTNATATPLAGPTAPKEAGATVPFAAFAQLCLRVGVVRAAERLPKSNKLLRLEVDLGEAAPRQILAGLGKAYAPEQLVHTHVLVVANLEPAKIMGHTSAGMVLAADAADGTPVLLRPDPGLPPGAAVH